ncbi:MAG: DUF4003 family protein [Lachnospiraceae bacterium]|nr:DUF4003 family protein [Lachnospiraceae bacterium]
MNQELQERCQLFVDNKNALDKGFVWDGATIMPICAMLHAQKNQKVNVEKMKECRKILKGKVGVFSGLRSYGEMVLLSKMALAENSTEYLEKTLQAYALFKKYKLSEDAFTAMAAMLLVDHVDMTRWELTIEAAKRIYTRMKKDHPFLTGTEDVSFAILMAMSELPEEWMMHEMEACYQALHKKFGATDGSQSLSHVLAMNQEDTAKKCEAILELDALFKGKKKKFDSRGIVMYGSLYMLQMDKEEMLDAIIEVDAYLKQQKGFGAFSVDSYQRLMYATMLVMNQYEQDDSRVQMSVLNNVIATIIAEYIAMLTTLTVVMLATSTTNN